MKCIICGTTIRKEEKAVPIETKGTDSQRKFYHESQMSAHDLWKHKTCGDYYFKVVKNIKGKRISPSSLKPEAIVEYKPDEYVHPNENCGGLLLYNNFYSAVEFAYSLRDTFKEKMTGQQIELWICAAEDVNLSPQRTDIWFMQKMPSDNYFKNSAGRIPLGNVVVAQGVKLLKPIIHSWLYPEDIIKKLFGRLVYLR